MKSKIMRTSATIICVLLAVAITLSAIILAVPKDSSETIMPVTDFVGGAEVPEETVGNHVVISARKLNRSEYAENGISPLAESAQQLTATVTPSDANNKAVDWSISWKDASSSWASGKTVTQYVTVTPISDGALTANVACLQAFGEQVIVTVTSRDNEQATASTTVDYRKRIDSVSFSYNSKTYNSKTGITLAWLGSKTQDSLSTNKFTINKTIGTVDFSQTTNVTVYLQYEQSYVQAICSAGLPSIAPGSAVADYYAKKSLSNYYSAQSVTSGTDFKFCEFDFFIAFKQTAATNARNVPYQVWSNSAATVIRNNFNNKKIATLTVAIPTAEYGTVNVTFDIKYDMANVSTYVEGVSISGNGLVF